MSRNSFFQIDHLLQLNLSSTSSLTNFTGNCIMTTEGLIILSTFFAAQCVLLLPTSVIIVSLGLRRVFQSCFSSIPITLRHSDVFIYHMAAMEFVGVPGCILIVYSIFQNQLSDLIKGYYMWSFAWYGETFLYILICMEHYLAVVHPVTYWNLQKGSGIKFRNITIGCVWLFNFGKMILLFSGHNTTLLELYIMIFFLIALCFSIVSILLVLIGPVVGEHGKKMRLNKSKKRAFYCIIVIQTGLLIRCLLSLILALFFNGTAHFDCLSVLCAVWLNLPCSLTLPLLLMQRTGMLTCYNSNTSKN